MDQEKFSNLFYLLHKSGEKLNPVRMQNRDTGKSSFRVSPGGTGGNTKEIGIEVDCELEMKNYVVNKGYAVRASTKNGTRKGFYKVGQRNIVSIVEIE